MTRQLFIAARDVRRFDAVGEFAVDIRNLMSDRGVVCYLVAENCDDFLAESVLTTSQAVRMLNSNPDSILFYNHSIGDPALEKWTLLPNPKIFYFHNITPPELISDHDLTTKQNCILGYAQLQNAARFNVVVCNSLYSASILRRHVDLKQEIDILSPTVIDLGFPKRFNASSAEQIELIYIGRQAHHKNIDLMVAKVSEWAEQHPVRLRVFSSQSNERLDRKLGIEFRYRASNEELMEALSKSDALITFSEHEGFCVPASFAVHYGKPVIHRNEAVSETSGPFGINIDLGDSFHALVSRLQAMKEQLPSLDAWQDSQYLRMSSSHVSLVLEKLMSKASC